MFFMGKPQSNQIVPENHSLFLTFFGKRRAYPRPSLPGSHPQPLSLSVFLPLLFMTSSVPIGDRLSNAGPIPLFFRSMASKSSGKGNGGATGFVAGSAAPSDDAIWPDLW